MIHKNSRTPVTWLASRRNQ